jgi:hypothetical protein
VIIAESSHPRQEDLPEGARGAVRALLDKEPSLGWDTSTSSSTSFFFSNASTLSTTAKDGKNSVHNHGNPPEERQFKGLRLPLYEVSDKEADDGRGVRIWTFCCAYNPVVVSKRRAQAFLEKVAMITEFFRESNQWRTGAEGSCQDEFGQILQQRMEETADPSRLAVDDESLEYSAQIVKTNRVVLNAVRMREANRRLLGESSSSSTASRQENRDPTSHAETRSSSYLGLFKSLGGSSKPLVQQQQQTAKNRVQQQHRASTLRFVASSVKQRDVAAADRSAHNDPEDPLSSLEQRNELPTLHRSRTDSMEDFLQALEREACMPVPPPPPPSKGTETNAEAEVASAGETGVSRKPEATASPRSPGRQRRANSPATRAETMAILVVMMLSCLLGTLPRSILDLPLINLGAGEPSRDDRYKAPV